ncbi:MAG TPA: tRNA-uridine aminocarboxypropyltransferase [Stellaceae bacterium]|jgi:DTW domain-containing protein|nr:tRNA-uridine aminocarboxypropyltransferase [Stellaceae bacterium]
MDDSDPIDNRLFVLILQHPREKKEALATAALTLAMLRRAALAVGLSWANLGQALGRPADPRRWAVLYLGSARPRAFGRERDLVALDRHGEPEVDQRAALRDLEGAVLLDGSWGEAKALWWRNPWLLKLRRLVLDPQQPSHYNRVRREPRREALSTIEAAALLLSRIDGRPEIEVAMNAALDRLIAETRPRARALGSNIL